MEHNKNLINVRESMVYHSVKKISNKVVLGLITSLLTIQSVATDFNTIGSIGPGINDRLNIKESSADVMGDQITLSSGGLSLRITDETLQGNGPLISLTRQSTFGVKKVEGPVEFVGGWELSLPYIKTTTLHLSNSPKGPWEGNGGDITCKNEAEFGFFPFYTNGNIGGGIDIFMSGAKGEVKSLKPEPTDPTPNFVNYAAVGTHEFYNGIFFSIPGQVHELVGAHEGNITKSGWKKGCVNNSASTINGAFSYYYQMTSPSGTVYSFAQPKRINVSSATGSQGLIENTYMLITNITDRFGNSVNYNYKQLGRAKARLENIVASDGRKIAFKYENGTSTQITQADILTTSSSTIMHSYRYGYENDSKTISYAQRPDGKKWLHNLSTGYQADGSSNYCGKVGTLNFDITNPNGLKADFSLVAHSLPLTNVKYRPIMIPSQRSGSVTAVPDRYSNIYETCSPTFSIKTKTLTLTNGETYQWTYDYNNGGAFYLNNYDGSVYVPTNDQRLSNNDIPEGLDDLHVKTTKVTEPDGSYTIHFYNKNAESRHLNAELASQSFDSSGNKKQTIITEYDDDAAIPIHVIAPYNESVASATHRSVKRKQSIISHTATGDDIFTTNYLEHNEYALPTLIKSTFNGKSKYTKQSYMHDEELWVINQPTTTQISDVNSSYTTVAETSYYAKNHGSYPSMPYQEKSFGVWQQMYSSYHTNGNVNRVEYNSPLTNGGGNKYALYENYKRGKAQKITLPCAQPNACNTANGSTKNTVIVKLEINNNGTTKSITDFAGSKTNYKYDTIGRLTKIDPVDSKWSNTNIAYGVVNTNNDGLPGSGAKIGELKQTINQGKYQKRTYFDSMLRPYLVQSRDTNNTLTTAYQRNEYDHQNRVTFASFPSNSITIASGMRSNYDALGRKISDTRTTDNAITRYSYLSNNRVSVTDPKNNTTTTSYLAYGSPSQSKATYISSPEGVTTAINYNLFGQINTITQGGITESRFYDNYQQLCKTVRPDTGITAFGYNAARQLVWQAEGASGSANDCDTGQVTSTQKTRFNYNNRGNISFVNYPDGSPDKAYKYNEKGQLKTLTAGSTVWNYLYNSLGLVEKQTLAIGSKSFVLNPEYNSLGHMKSFTYPSGRVVDFAPNALGQATKAGGYAKSAKYYANGTLDSFTYGNNLTYKRSLNSAQLPYELSVRQGSSYKSRHRYLYDDNNNVDYIYDFTDRSYDIDLGYDALDRIVSGSGKWGSGSFSYDDLGNLKTKKLGSQALTYHYDTGKNRLGSVTVSNGANYSFNYDARGNVVNNGRFGLIFNRANQVTNANGNVYTYDGHNRLVKKVVNGKTTYSVYGLSGTMYYREDAQQKKNDYIRLGSELVAKDNSVISSTPTPPTTPVVVPITTAPTITGSYSHKKWNTHYFNVNWQSAGMSNITHFELYKSADAIAPPPPPPSCFKLAPCYEFRSLKENTIMLPGEWVRAYSGSNLSIQILDRTNTIDVKVRACNSLGCGPYSPVKSLSNLW